MTHTYSNVPPAAPSGGEPSFTTPPVAPAGGDFREPSLSATPAEPAAQAEAPSAKSVPPVERIPVWQAETNALHGALGEVRKRLARLRFIYGLAGLLGLAALVIQHLEIVNLRADLGVVQQRADTLGAAVSMQQANLAQLDQRVDAMHRASREADMPRYQRHLHN